MITKYSVIWRRCLVISPVCFTEGMVVVELTFSNLLY
jgi:hypothetical protein